uniref:CRE01736 n=1 Tax=Caenorhabditis remanei TaxID=31234 RepID=A0A097F125_CAERE|nr:CRE01736 [Caenorhabditis remanei]
MEQSPQWQELLRPAQQRHVPLTHNFYEAFLRKNPGYNPNMETSSAPSTPNSSTSTSTSTKDSSIPTSTLKLGSNSSTSKLVNEIIESNKQLIEEATMQKAASGVNVTTTQYSSLIPLSFDQEQFLQNHEATLAKKPNK